jgi:hypothetical protein
MATTSGGAMAESYKSHTTTNARGYLLIHRDWYELTDEPDLLRRNAIVLTLNRAAYQPANGAQIVKRGFEILQLPNELPFAFTICDCPEVGGFETMEDAENYLRAHGVRKPRLGLNPVG